MIIPVKTLNNAGHIAAKLIDFSEISQKIQRNRLFFTDCFLAKFPSEIARETGRSFYEFAPENPWKFDFFPAKIPRNRPIFPQICPWKSREILLFFREISEALSSDMD